VPSQATWMVHMCRPLGWCACAITSHLDGVHVPSQATWMMRMCCPLGWCACAVTIVRHDRPCCLRFDTHTTISSHCKTNSYTFHKAQPYITLTLFHDMCTSYQNMLEIKVSDHSQISVCYVQISVPSTLCEGKNNVQRLC